MKNERKTNLRSRSLLFSITLVTVEFLTLTNYLLWVCKLNANQETLRSSLH